MGGKKQKVLICGPVKSKLSALSAKLSSLNSSKAGPFDVCFCCGPFLAASSEPQRSETDKLMDGTIAMPIKVFFQDIGAPSKAVSDVIDEATNPYSSNGTASNGAIKIADNCHYLGSNCGLANVENLVVSWVGKNASQVRW